MKTVIVACGSGIATSTIISSKVEELLQQHHIEYRLIQCSLNELDSYIHEADVVVSSMQIFKNLPVPKVMGMAYLTGIGVDKTNEEILAILNK